MGMNTEEWFEWLFQRSKLDKKFNLETIIFLLEEIEGMSPLIFDGCPCYDYFKVKKLVWEAKKIAIELTKPTCVECGCLLEDVRTGKTQCPNCR